MTLILANCSSLFPPKTSHPMVAHPAQLPNYSAGDYVEHVSHADFVLSGSSPNLIASLDDLGVLEAYTSKRPHKKSKHPAELADVQIPVAVLECKAQNGDMEKLLSPYATEHDVRLLKNLTGFIESQHCVFYNIEPVTLTVKRPAPLSFDEDDADQAGATVKDLRNQLLATAQRPKPLTEVQEDIKLAHIFIDGHDRDAAYIVVENAKQSLANAENGQAEKTSVDNLLKQIESLEKQLRREMPFRF